MNDNLELKNLKKPPQKYCHIEQDIYYEIAEVEEKAMKIWGTAIKLKDELEELHLKMRDLIKKLQNKETYK